MYLLVHTYYYKYIEYVNLVLFNLIITTVTNYLVKLQILSKSELSK